MDDTRRIRRMRNENQNKKKKMIILIIVTSLLILGILIAGILIYKDVLLKEKVTEETFSDAKEFGVEAQCIYAGTDRNVAVMIDNEKPAWPHCGLQRAYALYEAIIEGGESRIMALFRGAEDLEKVGPVRSSRHYFVYLAAEHDAIYTHIGWSPKAQSEIKELSINNINGVTGDSSIFKKDKNNYHSAFTSMEKILELSSKKGYISFSNPQNGVFKYDLKEFDIQGQIAQKINIPYSNLQSVQYEYDETNKVYKRFMRNTPHVDRDTGEQYTAKNIIIQFASNYNLKDSENKGRQEVEIIGTGKGYFITNGKYEPITWEKKGKTAQTVFKNMDGEQLKINNGNIWVNIVPINAKVTFE